MKEQGKLIFFDKSLVASFKVSAFFFFCGFALF